MKKINIIILMAIIFSCQQSEKPSIVEEKSVSEKKVDALWQWSSTTMA